jgi:2-keto-myo-inositol isomerase
MKACISQVTTLMNPFESDASAYRHGGWPAVELWLTKLESFVEGHSAAEAAALFESSGVVPAAAAGQGGLLLSQGAGRAAHWDHFRRRLDLLAELKVPTLILAADSAPGGGRAWTPEADDLARAAAALGEAAELAGTAGVRIALEFPKTSPICACLETAVALVVQCGSPHAGICLDAFHFHTGPSKLADLEGLPAELIAWVQLCDLSGVPRELAGDADRILPGDGDIPLGAILDRLEANGYGGHVALELLNPQLWRIAADRVSDMGRRALGRVLGRRDDPGAPPARGEAGSDADREGGP